MKTFKDTTTGEIYQFGDHDDVRSVDGVYVVFDVLGNRMFSVPETLEPAELPPPEPPAPAYKTQFSVRDFAKRFTLPEQIAIRQASLTDMEVGLVYDDFNRAQFIDVEDPEVALGLDLYVSKGLIESERKAELLSPEAAQ